MMADSPEILFQRAMGLQTAGRFEAACEVYTTFLQSAPEHIGGLNNRANSLAAIGSTAAALSDFAHALRLAPHDFDLLYNCANVLLETGQLESAVEHYEQALHWQPEHVFSHFNRAVALTRLGRLDAAQAGFERTLQLEPEHADALCNLGLVLWSGHRVEAALVQYDRALQLRPQHIEARHNRAAALHRLGRTPEALASYRQVWQMVPQHAHAAAQSVHLQQQLCQWDNLERDSAAVCAMAAQQAVPPFIMLTLASSAAAQQIYTRPWARENLAPRPPDAALPAVPRSTAARRLRIAYLSSDLYEHATAFLMAAVFEAHQRQDLECSVYSYSQNDGSPMRRRLQAAFHRFEEIGGLSARAAARRIQADEIDILIDLKGYTEGNNSAILGYRPAPLQVQFLGYPGTMGSTLVDYLIADRFIIPPEHFEWYDEQIVYLPGCYQPNDPQRVIGPVPSRAEAGLPPQGFVFCCFNQSYKITPAVFDQWMRLLRAVPGSVLWLLARHPQCSVNLQREAQARGVDPARLIFAPKMALAAHLGRLTLADLFLDTTPVNAHTTASDALWAGVPVLTCPGQSFAARVAGSLLQALDLPELITDSPQQYEQRAWELAGDPARLGALKATLAAARSSSSLFNAERHAAHLETAYRAMWQRHQAGLPPATITVPA